MRLVDYMNEIVYNHNFALIEEYNKRCYELFDSVNGEKKKLEEIEKEEGISVCTIRKRARIYYEKHIENSSNALCWEDKYYKEPLEKVKKPPKHTALYMEILKENDSKKIIKMIENAGVDVDILRRDVYTLAFVFPEEQSDNLIESLKNKINLYFEEKNNNKKILKQEEEKLVIEKKRKEDKEFFDDWKWVLEDFVIGNYDTKSQCCKVNNIDIETFNYLVKLLEIFDGELLKKYSEVIEEQKKKSYLLNVDKVNELVYYLKNGIKENEETREFNIIDYYLLIKLDFNELLKIMNSMDLNAGDLRLIKIFMNKNKNYIKEKSIEVHQILNPNNKHIIGDRVIDLKEKELVLNFLKKNGIPKNNYTYGIAIRRYLMKVDKVKELVYYLKNGINENEEIREFNIIDYYLLIKLDFNELSRIMNSIDLEDSDLKILKLFINKNKNYIMDKSVEVHQILNPNNKHIIGDRVIELKEKELVLNFLKKNGIPKNNYTYGIAIRRYLSDNLVIDEERKSRNR